MLAIVSIHVQSVWQIDFITPLRDLMKCFSFPTVHSRSWASAKWGLNLKYVARFQHLVTAAWNASFEFQWNDKVGGFRSLKYTVLYTRTYIQFSYATKIQIQIRYLHTKLALRKECGSKTITKSLLSLSFTTANDGLIPQQSTDN